MFQVKQAGWVTLRVDGRGAVVWCDDWAGLLRLILRGHPHLKLDRCGEPIWVG
jgi:hypothetical protein